MKLLNKKLLFVVNDPEFFLSHRSDLARAAKNDGAIVYVASPGGNSTTAINKEFFHRKLNISRKGLNILQEIFVLLNTIRIFISIKPDLVHLVAIKSVIFGGIAARVTKTHGVVNAITGLGYLFTANTFTTRWLARVVVLLLKVAMNHGNSTTIFQNKDDIEFFRMKNLLQNTAPRLIKGSGVNLGTYHPVVANRNNNTVLMASRLLWCKGIKEYIDAARVFRNNPNYRFILAGDIDKGNPDAVPLTKLTSWVKEKIIEWDGYIDDMVGLFAQVDIVCLPTTYGEGVPKVLIEAAACGKPIITTNTPGCREIVQDGKNGILITPGSTDELIISIQKLGTNEQLRERMGMEGRRIVEKEYSIENVIRSTIDIYKEMVEEY